MRNEEKTGKQRTGNLGNELYFFIFHSLFSVFSLPISSTCSGKKAGELGMRNEEKTGKQRTGNWEREMSFTSSFSILCFLCFLFPAHQFHPPALEKRRERPSSRYTGQVRSAPSALARNSHAASEAPHPYEAGSPASVKDRLLPSARGSVRGSVSQAFPVQDPG